MPEEHALSEIILFTSDQIKDKIDELAACIMRDYKDKQLVIVCVLNGGYMFTSDLSKALWRAGLQSHEVDFVRISSYRNGRKSSGQPVMTKDVETSIVGKDVLIVDDIIETGSTIIFLKKHLLRKNPATIKTCMLLTKPKRKENIEPDYVGFEVSPDDWVEGYGLDTASFGRGRSDIIKRI